MIVIHNRPGAQRMSLITNEGHFIQQLSKHVVNPRTVFATNYDSHVIVYDGADHEIKVLSPDSAQLL